MLLPASASLREFSRHILIIVQKQVFKHDRLYSSVPKGRISGPHSRSGSMAVLSKRPLTNSGVSGRGHQCLALVETSRVPCIHLERCRPPNSKTYRLLFWKDKICFVSLQVCKNTLYFGSANASTYFLIFNETCYPMNAQRHRILRHLVRPIP